MKLGEMYKNMETGEMQIDLTFTESEVDILNGMIRGDKGDINDMIQQNTRVNIVDIIYQARRRTKPN